MHTASPERILPSLQSEILISRRPPVIIAFPIDVPVVQRMDEPRQCQRNFICVNSDVSSVGVTLLTEFSLGPTHAVEAARPTWPSYKVVP